MELILISILISCVVFALIKFKQDSETKAVYIQKEIAKQNEEKERILALEEQYGKRGATLDKEALHVWVFDESRNVVVFNVDFSKKQVFSFDEIIGCDLSSTDNVSESVISETTHITKTSGKSMAGRALAGAVIAGPVGAIIGGATAKRTTVSVTKNIPQKTVNTTWCAVIYVLKDGVEERIPCYGYGSNKLKTMIDNIIATRNTQIEK